MSWLSAALERHGMTPGDLQERLPAPQQTVSTWIRDTKRPSPFYRRRLAALFGVTELEIMRNIGPHAVEDPNGTISEVLEEIRRLREELAGLRRVVEHLESKPGPPRKRSGRGDGQ